MLWIKLLIELYNANIYRMLSEFRTIGCFENVNFRIVKCTRIKQKELRKVLGVGCGKNPYVCRMAFG